MAGGMAAPFLSSICPRASEVSLQSCAELQYQWYGFLVVSAMLLFSVVLTVWLFSGIFPGFSPSFSPESIPIFISLEWVLYCLPVCVLDYGMSSSFSITKKDNIEI